jgi:nucleotide-binding universal stress UspA family protein
MPFQKILVALDRAFQTSLVFEIALEQAQARAGALMIAHILRAETDVQTAPFLGLGTIADVDMYGTLKQLQRERIQHDIQKAKEWLQPYVDQAIAANVPTEMDCRAGEPGVAICETARNWGADLIVMGRRGHQGLKEVVLGSVSNYVLHHAPCSVLIVQGSHSDSSEAKEATQAEVTS